MKMKPKIKEVIIVEGKYDKNTLLQVVDATIISTGGFSIFKDHEKINLIKSLAQSQGIIVLTDSDGAGFMIRNYLKSSINNSLIKEAYIPDVSGKEKRKRKPGKEGKLGVEGMKPEIILDCLIRCGATVNDSSSEQQKSKITKAQLLDLGLIGANSSVKRQKLLVSLGYPSHMSTNSMMDALNLIMTYNELIDKVNSLS